MDEIKFKIALKVNDLYYFMMHHYYSKPAGIIGLVLSIGSLVLLITRLRRGFHRRLRQYGCFHRPAVGRHYCAAVYGH